jgi:tyrosine-protein kinase Etk/Wzc
MRDEVKFLAGVRDGEVSHAPQDLAPAWRPAEGTRFEEPTLRELVQVVRSGAWTVVLAVALAVLLGAAYLLVRTPTYAADVVVQVEPNTPSLARLDDVAAPLGELPSETELELLRSRSLVDAVVGELGLDTEVRPRTLPVVGAAVARMHRGPGLAQPWFGLDRYAWGGERLEVQRLSVTDDLFDTPMAVTAVGPGRFAVEAAPGTWVQGEVAKPLTVSLGAGRVELLVSSLNARSGTGFVVTKRRRTDVVDGLLRRLTVSERGSERGKKTGILVATLEGSEPSRVAAVVDALATAYLRQNAERRSAEAGRTLAFLQSQLGGLRERVGSAESALNAYQRQHGVVDLSQQTQSMLSQSAELARELSQVELQRSELRQRFADQHPQMLALEEKAATLRAKLDQVDGRMRGLPQVELESARLAQQAKAANSSYLQVLNRTQELQSLASGSMGNARIVDHAVVPRRPIRPEPVPVLLLALVMGTVAGVAATLARKPPIDEASDPDVIERTTGIPLLASIPHSARQQTLARRRTRRWRGDAPLPILAAIDPGDVAVENLRSLRTSLQFALASSTGNVVAISGPRPGLGKSFVIVNLAHVLAGAGQRVLLIDGDLRRGALHRYFGRSRSPGLAELVAGAVPVEQALRGTDFPNLDLLPTGQLPPNPAELLGSDRFPRTLADVSARYDLVLVDTPPVLAVTDAAMVARAAGVLLLVLRAGQNPLREIQAAVKRFARGGARVQGAVLNDVLTRGQGSRYEGHYFYVYPSAPSD